MAIGFPLPAMQPPLLVWLPDEQRVHMHKLRPSSVNFSLEESLGVLTSSGCVCGDLSKRSGIENAGGVRGNEANISCTLAGMSKAARGNRARD